MRTITAALAMGLLAISLIPRAQADEFDHKTIVTINEPVEIPGRVLPAGTYVFRLVDSQSDRHIVQILNQREDKVFATLLTIPTERARTPSKTLIKFEERPANSPEAIKAWFYPGDNTGEEFVYPRTKALAIAKANKMPVKAMPDESAANVTKSEVPTPKPLEEAHVADLKQAPVQVARPKPEDREQVEVVELAMLQPQALPAELPHTSTSQPLITLSGLLLMGIAGVIRLVRA